MFSIKNNFRLPPFLHATLGIYRQSITK